MSYSYLHFLLGVSDSQFLEEQFQTSLPQLRPIILSLLGDVILLTFGHRIDVSTQITFCHHWNLTGDEILKPRHQSLNPSLCGFCLTLEFSIPTNFINLGVFLQNPMIFWTSLEEIRRPSQHLSPHFYTETDLQLGSHCFFTGDRAPWLPSPTTAFHQRISLN